MDSELSLTGVDLGEIAGRGCQGGALGVLVPSLNRPGLSQLTIFAAQPATSDSRSSIVNLKLSLAQELIGDGALRALVRPGTVIIQRLARCEMQSDAG